MNSAWLRHEKIFCSPAGLSALVSVLLLLPFLGIGFIQPVSAEPFVRVCKDGVIHYYFANRPSNKPSVIGLSRHNQPPHHLAALDPPPGNWNP